MGIAFPPLNIHADLASPQALIKTGADELVEGGCAGNEASLAASTSVAIAELKIIVTPWNIVLLFPE
jgi:hypothetical protein